MGRMLWLHLLGVVLFVGLLPLALMLVLRVNAWRSARSRASTELARVRALPTKTVTGTLRVEGALALEEPQRSTGAVTIWSSARRFSFARPVFEGRERAAKLFVVAGAHRYELRGPVEVLAGSRVGFPGVRADALDRKAFVVRASLADGDEVIVAGVAAARSVDAAAEAASDDGAAAYRDRGDAVLGPLPDAGVIFACATARPTTRAPLRALMRHFGVIPLALLGCVPLYAFASDYERTECKEACKSSGLCVVASNFETRALRDALDAAWRGRHVDCAALSDAPCAASEACRVYGRCTAQGGTCVATRGEDCRATVGCLDYGLCSPFEGRCSAVTEEDCRTAEGCLDSGRCVPLDGTCAGVTDESCASTTSCREYGNCSARGGSCVAATAKDCAETESCREYGRCSPERGSCAVVTDADCRVADSCKERGLCSAEDGRCVAKTINDCRGSSRCAEQKECKPSDGKCVEDAPTCRASLACSYWGQCDGDAFCRAEAKADCAKAEVCDGKTDCRPLAGSCATSCRETQACGFYGRCSDGPKETCVVGSDADCASSWHCQRLGFCSLHDGSCALRSDADCARTRGCKARGWCALDGGSCSIGSPCDASAGCRLLGRCSPDSYKYRCEVKTDDDCKKSEVCAKYGWCSPVLPSFHYKPLCGPAPKAGAPQR